MSLLDSSVDETLHIEMKSELIALCWLKALYLAKIFYLGQYSY